MPETASKLRETNVIIFKNFPIYWFGDRNQYDQSEIKVITVGLNPSDLELRASRSLEPDTKLRFPAFDGTHEGHVKALNDYFRVKPYKAWFQRSFGNILSSFNSSFYDNAPNRALHTDFCSPYATSPSWSKLPKDVQNLLFQEGVKLWHDLVFELKPDYILMSITNVYKNEIRFNPLDDWKKIENITSIKPLEKRNYCIDGKKCTVIFQTQGRWPFMYLSKDIKKNLYKNYLKI